MAQAIFKTKEATAEAGSDGKVVATISARGFEETGFPASIIDTAKDGINNTMKKIQLAMFMENLNRFVAQARKRNLGDLTLTLKTQTISGGKGDSWVDTYRLHLPGERFEAFAQIKSVSFMDQPAAAEKVWEVQLDEFGKFQHSKQ